VNILVFNTGSSTVKARLFDMERGETLFAGSVDGAGDVGECLRHLVDEMASALGGLPHLAGIGHRVVHGGERFTSPRVVDRELLRELSLLDSLAPLHNPACLAGVAAAGDLFPGVPQAVCFDTAFHASQPAEATVIALPAEYRQAGLRRYGFHGLSFEHVAAALPGIAGDRAQGRVIVAHLGSGVSLCALHRLKSVATTMGFSTLDGPPMATRCGGMDPGVILYLLEKKGLDRAALTDLLYRRSGLLGISGISGDMRTLLADPSPDAAAAVRSFVYRVVRAIGSLIRAEVCACLSWLGVEIDRTANEKARGSISAAGSPVGVYVLPADEEFVIARHTLMLLRRGGAQGINESEVSQ
jgi:acetate kinase